MKPNRKLLVLFLFLLFTPLILFSWNYVGVDRNKPLYFILEELYFQNELSADQFKDYPLYRRQFVPEEMELPYFNWKKLINEGKFSVSSDAKDIYWGIDIESGGEYKINQDSSEFFGDIGIGGGIENEWFTAYTRYILDQELVNDTTFQGMRWWGTAAMSEKTFFSLHPPLKPNMRLLIGKAYSGWGNGLLLNHKLNPLNKVQLGFNLGGFHFKSLLGFLNDMEPQDTLWQGAKINRYLSAHRVELDFLDDNLQIGLSEAMIFGGKNRRIEPYYLIPLFNFHVEQVNHNYNDNTFVAADFDYKFLDNFRCSGQAMIDDIQVESKTAADREPTEYGVQLRFSYGNVFKDHPYHFLFKGTKVANWTYNQKLSRNRYLYMGECIGFSQGNDVENMTVGGNFWFKDNLVVDIKGMISRKGEGSITSEWSAPWIENKDYNSKSPSGVVQEAKGGKMEIKWWKSNYLFIKLGASYSHIDNYKHDKGIDQNLWAVNLYFSPSLKLSFRKEIKNE